MVISEGEARRPAGPPPQVVELRVHGVGGGAPEQMVRGPIGQVAGDDVAGFWRGTEADGRIVEAYSWGGLTSRAGSRAWWLLLFPFSLVNLAGWMFRESRNTGRGLFLSIRVAFRLLALSMTTTYVLWVASLGLDLIGYQCAGAPACVADHWWLAPLRNPWFDDAHPGRRLAFGAIAPLALILLFAYLGRKTSLRYEARQADLREATGPSPLEQVEFWGGSQTTEGRGETIGLARVRRIARMHHAAALATLAGAIAWSMAELLENAGESRTMALLLSGCAAATLVLCAAQMVLWTLRRGRSGWLLVPLLLAVATFVATIIYACVEAVPAGAYGGATALLPGFTDLAAPMFGSQLALFVLVGLLLIADRRRGRPGVRGFRVLGALVASVLAVTLVNVVFAAIAIRVADLLGTAIPTGEDVPVGATAPIYYPVVYVWLSLAFATTLVALALVGGVAWLLAKLQVKRMRDRRTSLFQAYSVEQRPPAMDAETDALLRKITRATGLARLADHGDVILTGLAAAAALATFVELLIAVFATSLYERPLGGSGFVITAASWITSLMPLGAVWLVRRARQDEGIRRKVGIAWDVASFFPRHFHPLAPPCYAERAVPDLQRRLLHLTEDGGKVVVNAHSQGTVLAAAIAQLPAERRKAVALVTHGSPLNRLYRRYFPAVFSPELFARLAASLGGPQEPNATPPRWQNFYRATDPIGGPIFWPADTKPGATEFLDRPLLDPAALVRVGSEALRVRGHSDYIEDPAMASAIADLYKGLAGQPYTLDWAKLVGTEAARTPDRPSVPT